MKSQTVNFTNKHNVKLSGRLELPLDRKPQHFAIFAHCFTCGKDLRAERNISLALTQNGFGLLRFDFSGLGQSAGSFEDTNFSSNVEDLMAAAAFLKENYEEPDLLIGHSLGGTAAIMAGSQMDSVDAIVTIGAPSDPEHVLHLLKEDLKTIEEEGQATVRIAGREFNIKSQFLEDLQDRGMSKILQGDGMRGKSLLIVHSPQDETVEIENARIIYENARHPKSIVSIDGADHLLSDKDDSLYAGNLIAAWVRRYLAKDKQTIEQLAVEEQVSARLTEGPFLTQILAGHHHLLADEPEKLGGDDLGPTPYEFLAAGLGACTAMTIKLYAERKDWPLEEVNVLLNYDSKYKDDCMNCEDANGKIGRFERFIELRGDLDEAQRKRLLEIANKCPVHKTLSGGVKVHTELRDLT